MSEGLFDGAEPWARLQRWSRQSRILQTIAPATSIRAI